MKTRRLFKEDVYMKEAAAVITSVSETKNGMTAVTLDQTVFFPEGGGQSCDLGSIGPYIIIDVQEKGEEVIHTALTDMKYQPTC